MSFESISRDTGSRVRVSSSCRWHWHEGVAPDAPQNIEEAIARIDQLYNSGIPFFTKDELRAIHEQFQRSPGHGDEVLVRDVAGATIASTLKIGETFKHHSMESRDVLEEYIMYEVVDCWPKDPVADVKQPGASDLLPVSRASQAHDLDV